MSARAPRIYNHLVASQEHLQIYAKNTGALLRNKACDCADWGKTCCTSDCASHELELVLSFGLPSHLLEEISNSAKLNERAFIEGGNFRAGVGGGDRPVPAQTWQTKRKVWSTFRARVNVYAGDTTRVLAGEPFPDWFTNIQKVKATQPFDAPAGMTWLCPTCGSMATLGDNASFHFNKHLHAYPCLVAMPDAPITPPLDIPTEELVAYIKTMQDGERVKEFGATAMYGSSGTIYHNDDGVTCIMWDDIPGMTGKMGTSFTAGARRIPTSPVAESALAVCEKVPDPDVEAARRVLMSVLPSVSRKDYDLLTLAEIAKETIKGSRHGAMMNARHMEKADAVLPRVENYEKLLRKVADLIEDSPLKNIVSAAISESEREVALWSDLCDDFPGMYAAHDGRLKSRKSLLEDLEGLTMNIALALCPDEDTEPAQQTPEIQNAQD